MESEQNKRIPTEQTGQKEMKYNGLTTRGKRDDVENI